MSFIEEQSTGCVEMRYRITFKEVCRDLFYTFIMVSVIAVMLTVADSGRYFLSYFVMSQAFGLTICSITLFLFWLFKPQKWFGLLLVILIAVVSGVLIGMQTGSLILGHFLGVKHNWPMHEIIRTIVLALLFSIAAFYFFITRSKLQSRGEAIEQEKSKRVEVEKEALEAKLRMLQAQIEPHFLFNTLSNVISLIDTDPARGKAMLLDLTKYLRTSLSRTLPETTTLAQEMDMIKAYLNVQRIRMGERLNFKIDVPDALRVHPFPPMLLQPLVENAVKHGLEPKIEGGEIFIRAFQDHNLLRLEVADTGMGFADFNKPGVGMANVRERLSLLFGDKAKFIIEENHPSGVKAVIEVPVRD